MQDSGTVFYSRVFEKVDKLLEKDGPCIIAIEGMCGSGKSYLAKLISSTYDCNVFHMDDYFLPLEMKTDERLAEPGGNVHYERFKDEVVEPLRTNQAIIYRPYLCGVWKYDESKTISPQKLNIIEGSYCMHPILREKYDLTVFLEVDKKEQLKRIAQRNGEKSLQQFIDKWIPLENMYFSQLGIKNFCDITLDTTLI